jgi:hypothetical protein
VEGQKRRIQTRLGCFTEHSEAFYHYGVLNQESQFVINILVEGSSMACPTNVDRNLLLLHNFKLKVSYEDLSAFYT